MAVQQHDLTRLDAILKDRPLVDAVQDALNKATVFAEEITQELTLSGRKGIFPAQFGVNEAVYMRGDTGSFGDAKANQPLLAEVTAKFMYAIFEISGPLMSATRDNPGAFEDGLALSIENTIDGLKLDAARQYIGNGSGIMALIQSRTDADTVVIDSPFGIGDAQAVGPADTAFKSNVDVRGFVRKDQAIDILDETTPATKHVTNATVTLVSHTGTGTTIDHDGANPTGEPGDGDYVTRASNYNLEIEGFFKAVQSTGTYLNIARSGNIGWQGVLVDAANGGASAVPLDPNDLRDTVDLIVEESGQEPMFMVGNYKQRRNVYNLSAPQIRYGPMDAAQGLETTGVGSDNTVRFDNMRFVAERFFPPQHIGFVNPRFWYHAVDKDVEWIQGTNGTVLHFLLTSDTFRAVLRTYRNMACLFPAAQGILWGLEE
jgi:hypothetical protein